MTEQRHTFCAYCTGIKLRYAEKNLDMDECEGGCDLGASETDAPLLVAALELLEALRTVEFEGRRMDGDRCCPLCESPWHEGHAEDCQLHAAIQAATGGA